jgi:hypothetical protein
MEGTTLSEYALTTLRSAMERPTRSELLERIKRQPPTKSAESAADAVRAERDRR